MAKTLASVIDNFSHITIRIECILKNGKSSVGTGFIFSFTSTSSGNYLPLIITNKHVVEGAITGRFVLNKRDETNKLIHGKHLTVEIDDFAKLWRHHPDEEVDLCAMSFGIVIKAAEIKGDHLFFRTLSKDNIITEEQASKLSYFERIFMIGYPIGLWDDVNNRPIFRSGMTATHIKLDYCGKKQFLIDVACFPGSSGSPVIIFDTANAIVGETQGSCRLAGVLFAGPYYTNEGEIIVEDIPTVHTPIARMHSFINLGYVIKASRILELEPLFPTRNQTSE